MSDVREEVEELLEEKPHLESILEEIVAIDADGPWDFQDISADSGAFGEIVARDIVIETDDGYRLREPATVRAVLEGEDVEEGASDSSDPIVDWSWSSWSSVDRTTIGALIGVLSMIVVARSYFFQDVFYGGDIILLGNDPFIVRAQVETLVATTGGPLDPSLLTDVPGKGVRPLFLSTLAWFSELFGGSMQATGLVVALYPVVAAVITGIFLYLVAKHVSGDVRLGLASVAILAVLPPHVFRTALGFSDHHAFDYPLLVLTALCLVLLATVERDTLSDRTTWLYSTILGLAIGGGVLAWQGAPLLLVPLALYVAVLPISDLRADRTPVASLAPIAGGLLVASAITIGAHVLFGWQQLSIALVPVLLFLGTVGAAIAGGVFYRIELSARLLAGVESIGVLIAGGIVAFHPLFGSLLSRGIGYFMARQGSGIAETKSLVGDWGGVFAGSIVMFGLVWFFAVASLLFVTWKVYEKHRPGWLVAVIYTWYFLLLSLFVQRRFTGELGPFFALFGGVALIIIAAKTDIIEGKSLFDSSVSVTTIHTPTRQQVLYLGAVFLLVAGVSILLIPGWVNLLTHDTALHDSATWMDEYADEQGWEYPENYVFGESGDNPMLNYFVNGEPTYWYARHRFPDFLASPNETQWYETLRDRDYYNPQYRGPIGFIVTQDRSEDFGPQSMYHRLHLANGSATDRSRGLSHYRLQYIHPSGSPKVFTLVKGATITGRATPNSSVEVTTTVEAVHTEFTYRREVQVNATGRYSVTVPYPGRYSVGKQTVRVDEGAVLGGDPVIVRSDS